MPPNKILADIQNFLTSHRTGDVVDTWCEKLFWLLRREAYLPDWSEYPLATSYYQCREVSIKRKLKEIDMQQLNSIEHLEKLSKDIAAKRETVVAQMEELRSVIGELDRDYAGIQKQLIEEYRRAHTK